MKVKISTGLRNGITELNVISFSDFNKPKNLEPVNLNKMIDNGTGFIITAKGQVYISNDTPGYCDGENRVNKFI